MFPEMHGYVVCQTCRLALLVIVSRGNGETPLPEGAACPGCGLEPEVRWAVVDAGAKPAVGKALGI